MPDSSSAALLPWSAVLGKCALLSLKTTNGCNLRCAYCDVEADPSKRAFMPPAIAKRVADVWLPCVPSSVELMLVFHGGEPLLLSDSWYREVVEHCQDVAHDQHRRLAFGMATNGVLLTEKRIELFRELKINPSVSCDGPPSLHDLGRAAGASVENSIKLLNAAGMRCGVLLTVQPHNARHLQECMDYLSCLGCRKLLVNFLQPHGRGVNTPALPHDDMFEACRQIFEHMAKTNCRLIEAKVSQYVGWFQHSRRNGARNRISMDCGAAGQLFSVDWEGNIRACDGTLDLPVLGSVVTGVETQWFREKLRSFQYKGSRFIGCFDCAAKAICKFGCPANPTADRAFHEECEFTKEFYAYLQRNTETVDRVSAQLLLGPDQHPTK